MKGKCPAGIGFPRVSVIRKAAEGWHSLSSQPISLPPSCLTYSTICCSLSSQAALSALKQLSEQGLDPVDGPIKVPVTPNWQTDSQHTLSGWYLANKPTGVDWCISSWGVCYSGILEIWAEHGGLILSIVLAHLQLACTLYMSFTHHSALVHTSLYILYSIWLLMYTGLLCVFS